MLFKAVGFGEIFVLGNKLPVKVVILIDPFIPKVMIMGILPHL